MGERERSHKHSSAVFRPNLITEHTSIMATQTSIELMPLGAVDSLSPGLLTAKVSPAPLPSVSQTADPTVPETSYGILPKGRSIIVITQLSGVGFLTSFANGLLIVNLPVIAADLGLPSSLLVWPTAAFSLTSGTCLLVAGTVADVVGPRPVNLLGCLILSIFITACGLPKTGIELILFRAMEGIASALAVPSAVSIISTSVESGRPRNIGFACLGVGMTLGFSLGIVLAGVFEKTLNWRAGFYVGGAACFLLFLVGIFALPPTPRSHSDQRILKRLTKEIDWIGAIEASGSLAMFSYVLS